MAFPKSIVNTVPHHCIARFSTHLPPPPISYQDFHTLPLYHSLCGHLFFVLPSVLTSLSPPCACQSSSHSSVCLLVIHIMVVNFPPSTESHGLPCSSQPVPCLPWCHSVVYLAVVPPHTLLCHGSPRVCHSSPIKHGITLCDPRSLPAALHHYSSMNVPFLPL